MFKSLSSSRSLSMQIKLYVFIDVQDVQNKRAPVFVTRKTYLGGNISYEMTRRLVKHINR